MRSGLPIVMAFALAALACAREDVAVPRELLGRWVSADPDYAGRSLTLQSKSLVFGSGGNESEFFAVRGVEQRAEPDGSRSTVITYGKAGEERVLRIRRFETQPPSLLLGERAGRWTPALAEETPP